MDSSIPTEGKSFTIPPTVYIIVAPVLSQFWLWCAIIAPCLGAQTAAGLYDLFLNEEDPLTVCVDLLVFRDVSVVTHSWLQ